MIYLCCLRCLRDLKKWSWIEKIGKNRAKMGKNGCPKLRNYTLLTSVLLPGLLRTNNFSLSLWIPFQSLSCDVGFRRSVWPIHLHLRVLISVSSGDCLVMFHRSSMETTSGHLMFRIFLRHLLVNV